MPEKTPFVTTMDYADHIEYTNLARVLSRSSERVCQPDADFARCDGSDEAKSHPRGWITNLLECHAIRETDHHHECSGRGWVAAILYGCNSKSMDPANKTEIDKMCKVARKTVLERFTFQNHATRLLAVLDEAVLENSRS